MCMEIGVTESGYSFNVVHDSRTVNQDTADVMMLLITLRTLAVWCCNCTGYGNIYISVYILAPPHNPKDYCIFLDCGSLGRVDALGRMTLLGLGSFFASAG